MKRLDFTRPRDDVDGPIYLLDISPGFELMDVIVGAREYASIDAQITPEMKAGGRALVLHRMMRDGSKHWDELSNVEKLSALSEARVVLDAARRFK